MSRSVIVFSRREREYETIHRSASVVLREARTSTGTWYVAPPTRRLRTSRVGLTLSSARLSVTTGSLPVLSLQPSIAPYTMRSASDRLPLRSTLFTSAVTSGEPYTGSVTSWRLVAGPLRGMSALLLLRAVTAAGLLAVAHSLVVQRAADDLVPDAGEVPDPAAPDQHDRVLLQVVADTRDVGGDLDVTGQPHPGDLAERRVRLLGCRRVDARADSAALRASLERRGGVLGYLVLAALADQLLDRGHRVSVFFLLWFAPASGRGHPSLHLLWPAGFPARHAGSCLAPDPRARVCRRSRDAPGPLR